MHFSTAAAVAAATAATAPLGSAVVASIPNMSEEAVESLLLAELFANDTESDPEVTRGLAEMFLGRRVSLSVANVSYFYSS